MLMTTRNTFCSLWTRMVLINYGRIPKSRPVFVRPSRGWRTTLYNSMNIRPLHFLSTQSPVAENPWIFPSSLGHPLFRLQHRSSILVCHNGFEPGHEAAYHEDFAVLLISIFGELQRLGNSSHVPPASSSSQPLFFLIWTMETRYLLVYLLNIFDL